MSRSMGVVVLATLLAGCGSSREEVHAQGSPAPSPAAGAALATDEQKVLYALGVMLGGNVKELSLTPSEMQTVLSGFTDAAAGKKEAVDMPTYGPQVQQLVQQRRVAGAQGHKDKGKAFADTAAKEAGAQVLPSGLVIKTIAEGTGASPKASDTVKVHYTGKLIDGTTFDSSVDRGEPVEFPLGGVIPCWTEGVQKMKVGGKAQLICPSSIAYGDNGRPPRIPGGSTLVFDVELLSIGAGSAPPVVKQ